MSISHEPHPARGEPVMMTPSQIFDAGIFLAPLGFWGLMCLASLAAYVLCAAYGVSLFIEGLCCLLRGESR